MRQALKNFVEEQGRDIVERNLYGNFVLHCCNLFEFGVVGPALVFSAVTRMQRFLRDHNLKIADKKRLEDIRDRWMKAKSAPSSSSSKQKRRDFAGIFNTSSSSPSSSSANAGGGAGEKESANAAAAAVAVVTEDESKK